jgi:hypothetical protein
MIILNVLHIQCITQIKYNHFAFYLQFIIYIVHEITVIGVKNTQEIEQGPMFLQ